MKIVQEALYSLLSILWFNALQIAVVGSLWVLNVAVKEFTGVDVVQTIKGAVHERRT
jgi:hypothetical protein